MGYSIHADTIEELLAQADALRAYIDSAAEPGAPAGDKPARAPRGSRKKAEAPDPIQPTASMPLPEAAPGPSPFMAPAPAPEPPAPPVFTPPFAPAPAALAERPSLIRTREQLEKLSASHGRAQVYTWAIKQAGMSPSVTIDEFAGKLIGELNDAALDELYRQAGGI